MGLLAVTILLAACGGKGYHSTRGAKLVRFTLQSQAVEKDLQETLVLPARHGDMLLVLLHGRDAKPSQFLSQPFFDELAALGRRAPAVLLLDGGDHSFWHDRADGRWRTMVLREAIPAAVKRTGAGHVALGGISMGGFGALDLGAHGDFCAVGAHSPALWFDAGSTAPGAFDDASDFARHDLLARPPHIRAPVWIDVGDKDPFHDAAVALARKLHITPHVWPGGHESSYWHSHMPQYLRFYAQACG
jgi:enterochelin esterase-like enzyme